MVSNGPANPLDGSQYNKSCGNVDQTWLYRDSYQQSGPVWSLGGSGIKCIGGVSYSVASRSLDGGKTFSKVFTFPTAVYTPSITSTPSGTVAMFGCGFDSRPHLYYFAYNPDGTPTAYKDADSSALPNCGTLPASQVPGKLFSNNPTVTGASWGGSSPDGQRDAIRVIYPVVSAGQFPTQSLQVALYYLPHQGLSGALSEAPLRIEAQSSGGVIFRAGMLEPDATLQPGTPRGGLIWWEEDGPPHPDFNVYYQTSYAVVSGRSTLSRVQGLSLAAGAQSDFSVDLNAATNSCGEGASGPSNCRWVGEYDRGAFFQKVGELPQYFTQWSQADGGPAGVAPHFNIVQVDLPAISGFSRVGGSFTFSGSPAIASPGNGKLEAFARAPDGSVRSLKMSASGTWESTWTNWGGVIKGSPAVTSWGPDRLDAFGVGQNGHLWHLAIQNHQKIGDWQDLGGLTFADTPAAVSTGFGKVTVIGRHAPDGQVFSKTYDGGWGPWKPLGGIATGGIGAASWGPGRLDVFVTGQNADLWHYAEQGGVPQVGGGWEDLGGHLAPGGTPGVTARAAGGLEVVVTRQNAVWTSVDRVRYAAGHWGDWHDVGGATYGSPGLALPKDRPLARSRIVVRGLDNGLWVADAP